MTPEQLHTAAHDAAAVEVWETWGIAARWDPTHHWHHPDEDTAA
jgi:hypothetical protein